MTEQELEELLQQVEVAGLTLEERIEEQYRKFVEKGIIEISKVKCIEPNKIEGEIIKEALKRCNARKQRITPHPIPGIPMFLICVDRECVTKTLLEIIKERIIIED